METNGFFKLEIIINVLVSSFCFIWIPMVWVYGYYIFLIFFSVQRLSLDVKIWRLYMSDSVQILFSGSVPLIWQSRFAHYCYLCSHNPHTAESRFTAQRTENKYIYRGSSAQLCVNAGPASLTLAQHWHTVGPMISWVLICDCNVSPPSATLEQHQTSIVSTSRICWDLMLRVKWNSPDYRLQSA